MSLFQPPAPTSFDIHFRIFGIQVRIHPLFWLITILFGASRGEVSLVFSWIVVVFISILIHELGHSMAMRYYGQDSHIVLHGFGGLAIPLPSYNYKVDGPQTPWHHIVIALAGPYAGMVLASAVAVGVQLVGGIIHYEWIFGFFPLPIAYLPTQYVEGHYLVNDFLWVNIFWGLVNMMPVYPLDGGHVSRELFILFGRRNQILNSLWLSVITGVVLAVLGLVYLQSIYMAYLFGYLAYQSYRATQFV